MRTKALVGGREGGKGIWSQSSERGREGEREGGREDGVKRRKKYQRN